MRKLSKKICCGKDSKVELLIFRTFLKHVKSHGLYPIFRCSVNIMNKHNDMFHTLYMSLNPTRYLTLEGRLNNMSSTYLVAKNIEELLSAMKYTNGVNNLPIENSGDCQMRIMNTVNSLVHCCIEYGMKTQEDFTLLGKIGEDIFNEVCTKLFGEEFVDKTNEMVKPNDRHGFEQLMHQMSMNGERRYSLDKEFLDWLDKIKNCSDATMPTNVQPTYGFGDYYNNPQFIYYDDDGDFV